MFQKLGVYSGYAFVLCRQNHPDRSEYLVFSFPRPSKFSKLILIISILHLDPRPFVRQLSLYFQIRDDYQNLVSDQVCDIHSDSEP